MYVPRHFNLSESYVRQFLESPHPGNLITTQENGPVATFVPFYYDAERNTVVTHIVRNNSQAREPVIGPALVVFDVADAYVSPTYYRTNADLPNVPTWDYITIHVRGPIHVNPDPSEALRVARRLTELMGDAETIEPIPEHKLERMSRAIVAVEVEATEIIGKAKMSQNRHPEDIRSLAEVLSHQGHADMARYLDEVSQPYAEARYSELAQLRSDHRANIQRH